MTTALKAQCPVCGSWRWCERQCASAPKDGVTLPITRDVTRPGSGQVSVTPKRNGVTPKRNGVTPKRNGVTPVTPDVTADVTERVTQLEGQVAALLKLVDALVVGDVKHGVVSERASRPNAERQREYRQRQAEKKAKEQTDAHTN